MIRDPRSLQIIILTFFTLLGQLYLKFQVTPLQIIVTLITCTVLELLLTYMKDGNIGFPKSAIITGLSIALLLRADTFIPFLIVSFVAIGSKHLLQYKGNHIFNPSNIGIVAIILLFPKTVATAPLQWGFYVALLFIIAIVGTYMVYKVKRFSTILSFLGGFTVAGSARVFFWDQSFRTIFNEFMWGGLLIFTFFMITDPKTSPKSTKGQISYGLVIAILGQIMIHVEVNGALFISLALICLGRFLWIWGKDRWNREYQTLDEPNNLTP
ncbi:NQR2, RnfD, RnfE family [Alteribacillus bidgolensis]|uniref:NQR2, RnfD, RnfE family n=2 Tax=Alteribacillus bidgolensis TaxID=930129 RepID=A0A1G8R6S4_9BACI|nr:RnfABCDGE type electron transport complex subunit D [Alteribacillus bidgolensis]SDJ12686.1 NQR2, RnfD, RnfE family [Alteribacillus bidgolensis]